MNLFFLSLPCFLPDLFRIIGQKRGAVVARSDDASGWRGDYKELPSEKIKQERNHKFIKVPNLDHLIKARKAAECATKAARFSRLTLLATLLSRPSCRGGEMVF